MKSQKHNQGELTELTIKIETDVFESLNTMAKNSGLNLNDLIVIAVKRFRASHSDYMGNTPEVE